MGSVRYSDVATPKRSCGPHRSLVPRQRLQKVRHLRSCVDTYAAITLCQIVLLLTHRLREHARSHTRLASSTDVMLDNRSPNQSQASGFHPPPSAVTNPTLACNCRVCTACNVRCACNAAVCAVTTSR